MNKWFKAKVKKGNKIGSLINFPTVNLDPPHGIKQMEKGVFAAEVRISSKTYKGALYFGPRMILNETKIILEIYLLDFNENIYGDRINFRIIKKIRDPLKFRTLEEMKTQLTKDSENISEIAVG